MIEEIKKNLWENKEGIILGLISGYIIGKFILPNFIDLNVATQTYGIIDYIKGTAIKTIQITKQNIILASTIVGGLTGYWVDSLLKEGWLKKWL